MILSKYRKRSKFIASFLALNLIFEIIAPLNLMALTGGPSQPETSSFEPVGTTDMVDLFTGDFNYNIPLFDVGGYPVNISYHAGVSMDQEASWVGLGWNINPGAINRTMRGLPDDFKNEEIDKQMNLKENKSWAMKFNTDLEIFGFIGKGKRNEKSKNRGADGYHQGKMMNKLNNFRVGFGLVYNSYKGLGYSLDLSADIQKTTYLTENEYKKNLKNERESENILKDLNEYNDKLKTEYSNIPLNQREFSFAKDLKKIINLNENNSEKLSSYVKFIKNDKRTTAEKVTKGKSKLKVTLNYSLNSQEGSSFGANMSYNKNIKVTEAFSKSIQPYIGLGYNSFLGSNSFEAGFSYLKNGDRLRTHSTSSFIPIGTYTYVPNINMSTLSTSNSFNATIGFDAFGGHPNMRLSGFYNTEELEHNNKKGYAFGFLYENEVKDKVGSENLMMDFNREKEIAVNKNVTHLPLSNHTYDIYSVSGQGVGGMYRPHRKTIGMLHDGYSRNRNKTGLMNDLGLELGFGANFRIGINLKNKMQKSSTGIWGNKKNENQEDNELNSTFNYGSDGRKNSQFYFKAAGEQTPSDNDIAESWNGKSSVSLKIEKKKGSKNLRFAKLVQKINENNDLNIKSSTNKNIVRNNVITYLTAEESSHRGLGLDPYILSYPQNYWTNYIKNGFLGNVEQIKRYGGENEAKPHHISEIISLNGSGMRYVYGIPAYNTTQEEYAFAISRDLLGSNNNQKGTSIRNEKPDKGLVEYSTYYEDNTTNNGRGADHYFNSTKMPAYAHSYLLTGVLSPDYVDITGDGITDDDYGSAVKFNYYKTPGQYNWRTPYEKDHANLDEGFITDKTDNKASYIYGKKEQWYVQSMESKTHIAEFKISKRKDAHGVIDENGGLSTALNNTSMKLDSIVIYSKYDLILNGKNAVPVKTIIFKYDYSLCPGVPNNENGGGKLTLKSIYFTYGNSSKGIMNPYRFNYSSFNPSYSHVHYDRWGNYKYANEKLPNRYFPYDDYDISRDTFNKYSTAWNLTQVELPSGGKINVEYEADDYAYVQDRKAMQMMKIVGSLKAINDYNNPQIGSRRGGNSSNNTNSNKNVINNLLYNKDENYNYLLFKLTEKPSEIPERPYEYFKNKYFTDEKGETIDYLYFRFKVNMDPKSKGNNDFEYVSGYAKIDFYGCGITSDKKYGIIKLSEVRQKDLGKKTCNPIAKQAWQMGLQNLRKVIFPGSDLSQEGEDGSKQKAITGLKSAFNTSLNIFTGPYEHLRNQGISKHFDSEKSYVRLYNPNGKKVGGGCRVKKITINDNWNSMDDSQTSGQYGQEFSYITKEENNNEKGEVISSGVASYEPFIGNDENPFRRPSFYHTNRFMFPDLNEYHEEPFGETFFPSPTVGYSRVVVRNIPKPGTIATSTGKIVHQFYTAKDYPVITKNTPLKFLTNGGSNLDDSKPKKKLKKFTKALASLFSPVKRDYFAATQGYSIILNDMHGKPKSTAIYSSLDENSDPIERQFTGRLLSGSEYKYKTESSKKVDDFGKVFQRGDSSFLSPTPKGAVLDNKVWVMKENGQLEEKEIATSYDISIDARESRSNFRHFGVDWNNESFLVFTIPCPFPKFIVNQNLYQGSVVTKVIQQYGVLEETVAYDHSSIVKTKNLVWDEQTGAVILTSTTNEFDDPLYNYTYPAHLVYSGMGPAYKNIDFETDIEVLGSGEVNKNYLSSDCYDKFFQGDELMMRQNNTVEKAWVLKAELDTAQNKYKRLQIIDRNGNAFKKGVWNVRIIRSGRKNLASVPVGAITSMNKNIFINGQNNNKLVLNEGIIQSSAAVFSDEWNSYLNKAQKYKMKCDTIYFKIENLHQILKGIVNSPNTHDFKYDNTNPNNYPPSLNSISEFENELKTLLDIHTHKILKNTCGGKNFNIYDYFFASGSGNDSTTYYFKAKYKCSNEFVKKSTFLTCEISILPVTSCPGFSIRYADSISKIISKTSQQIKFYVYKNGDSCEYKLDFPMNNCFYDVNCYLIPDCDYLTGDILNPFVNNIKGVWRQKEAFAFNSTRKYENKSNQNTNIRKDGLIDNYVPFWVFSDNTNKSGISRNVSSGSNKWVSTGEATIYSPEGNGLEEKDALNIYSSQLFGYNNKLVTAQAGNARHKQIAFDNFEDYLSPTVGCDFNFDHFNFKEGLYFDINHVLSYSNINSVVDVKTYSLPLIKNKNVYIVRDTAHTGKFSLCLKGNKTHSASRLLNYNNVNIVNGNDSFYRVKNLDKVITQFAPTSGKYVVSAWVMEKHNDMNSVNKYENAYLNVKVYSGGNTVVNQDLKAGGKIIEGWQRIEGVFNIPSGADSIKITLVNDGNVNSYYDDFRINPFDSKMVGHVYDYIHLKVIAELDDNNYATYYEYDDEGTLVRVKRETEKGIITIQESRKSIRKSTQ